MHIKCDQNTNKNAQMRSTKIVERANESLATTALCETLLIDVIELDVKMESQLLAALNLASCAVIICHTVV